MCGIQSSVIQHDPRPARGMSGTRQSPESKFPTSPYSSTHFGGNPCRKIPGAHHDRIVHVAAIATLSLLEQPQVARLVVRTIPIPQAILPAFCRRARLLCPTGRPSHQAAKNLTWNGIARRFCATTILRIPLLAPLPIEHRLPSASQEDSRGLSDSSLDPATRAAQTDALLCILRTVAPNIRESPAACRVELLRQTVYRTSTDDIHCTRNRISAVP